MKLRLVIGAATDTGKVRDHNEDGYIVDDGLALVALADGMGGHRGGEVASATALEAFYAEFTENGGMHDAVVAANDAVLERAAADEQLRGMGTTLTAAVLGEDGTMIVGHVGDSRAYLSRGGEISRVSTDHSLVEELRAAGELTDEEAEHDPRRSMITRAVGLDSGIDVDMYPIALQAGDRLVLCSDGLTDMVRENDVQAVLAREPEAQRAADALVEAANAAGGVDNTTAIVIDVLEAESTEADGDGDADETVILPTVEAEEPEEPKRKRRFLRRKK